MPLPKAAVRRPTKHAHEIVKLLKGERLFQHRRTCHKSESLFGIFLAQGIHEFGSAGARTG